MSVSIDLMEERLNQSGTERNRVLKIILANMVQESSKQNPAGINGLHLLGDDLFAR
jgi:hypothetical protein